MKLNELNLHDVLLVVENRESIKKDLVIYQALTILNLKEESSAISTINYINEELDTFNKLYESYKDIELEESNINLLENSAYLIYDNYITLKNEMNEKYRFISLKMLDELDTSDIIIFKKYLTNYMNRFGSLDIAHDYVVKYGPREVSDFINQIDIYIKNFYIADLDILNHIRRILKYKDSNRLNVTEWMEIYQHINALISNVREVNEELYQILILSYFDFLVDYFVMVSSN